MRLLDCIVTDGKTCCVIRRNKAVPLGFMQFAIFKALHRRKVMTIEALLDELYTSAKNPTTAETLYVVINQANKRLVHIGVKVQGVRQGFKYAKYRIVEL